MSAVIRIPVRLVSVANLREHHAVKAKRTREHRGVARMLVLAARARWPERPYLVIITRIGGRKLDTDNLVASAKAVRDGISEALGVNDGDESAASWGYSQRRGEPHEHGAEVLIDSRASGWVFAPDAPQNAGLVIQCPGVAR